MEKTRSEKVLELILKKEAEKDARDSRRFVPVNIAPRASSEKNILTEKILVREKQHAQATLSAEKMQKEIKPHELFHDRAVDRITIMEKEKKIISEEAQKNVPEAAEPEKKAPENRMKQQKEKEHFSLFHRKDKLVIPEEMNLQKEKKHFSFFHRKEENAVHEQEKAKNIGEKEKKRFNLFHRERKEQPIRKEAINITEPYKEKKALSQDKKYEATDKTTAPKEMAPKHKAEKTTSTPVKPDEQKLNTEQIKHEKENKAQKDVKKTKNENMNTEQHQPGPVLQRHMSFVYTSDADTKKISEITTKIDELYNMVLTSKVLRIEQASKTLAVPENEIEKWGKILEENKLIEIFYPAFGKIKLLAPEEKVKKWDKRSRNTR